jgi:hypothetical protein
MSHCLEKRNKLWRTPEEFATEWLSTTVQRLTGDPLLQLAGVFESDVTDLSERHNDYIGQGLLKELRGNKDG